MLATRTACFVTALATVLMVGCAGTYPSVARFGSATKAFAEGMELTARGGAQLCEHKQRLLLDDELALGDLQPKDALARLRKDECTKFRDTGVFYGKLARQLGAFGLAMKSLAEAGETDYTEQLSNVTATDAALAATGLDRARVEAANGLTAKILGWFTSGYASGKISTVLTESKTDVEGTLALLEVVLGVYDVQLTGYSQEIDKVSTNEDYAKQEGESDVTFEARKAAQATLLKEHTPVALERARVLKACHGALASVRQVHADLVAEASRNRKQFDLSELVSKARTLAGEIAEFRQLVAEVGGG